MALALMAMTAFSLPDCNAFEHNHTQYHYQLIEGNKGSGTATDHKSRVAHDRHGTLIAPISPF